MMFFMLIAAVDRILSQSAVLLVSSVSSVKVSKDLAVVRRRLYGNGRSGSGDGRYDPLAPVLAHVLGPVIIPVYEMSAQTRQCSPERCWRAIWAASPRQRAGGRRRSSVAILWVNFGSMMGPTIVFSIPVALGIINLLTVVIWRSACWRAL